MAKTVAKSVPPVVALVGSDGFLQLQAQAELMREFPADAQRTDLDGETAALADVLDEVRCFALFGGAKVVVVRNADTFLTKYRQQLEDYLESPADSATLVLRLNSLPATQRVYKAIAKIGRIVPCSPPKDLAAWVVQRGKVSHGLTVQPEAARMLADLIGDDMGRIDAELGKLSLTCAGGRLTAEDVSQSVAFQREREMWDLTNALGSGDTAEALRRWRQLIQGDSSAEFRAVTWLSIWLENVRKALDMHRRGQGVFSIGQALRIWPQAMQQPFLKTAIALGESGAAEALDLLARIDHQTKTGVGDAAENVERFILTLAARRM
ncbi:MAG TPA: DNA polymerase III subunit delta [Tepidisphaeraceae bacterium]|nr:DNA polymerase III subunit delta [Tepidisphaeraceae bacterium]